MLSFTGCATGAKSIAEITMPAQIIEKNGRKEFAVLPYREYLRLQRKLEDYDDLKSLREARADPRNRKRRPLLDYMRERGITP